MQKKIFNHSHFYLKWHVILFCLLNPFCRADEHLCENTGQIEINGEKQFLTGINYAWHVYGGDFGGIKKWGRSGISHNPEIYDRALQDMANTGSRVIRWWMFPDLRGDGILIQNGKLQPGPDLFQDLRTALELAEKHDV